MHGLYGTLISLFVLNSIWKVPQKPVVFTRSLFFKDNSLSSKKTYVNPKDIFALFCNISQCLFYLSITLFVMLSRDPGRETGNRPPFATGIH